MLIRLDPSDPQPLFAQLAAAVRGAIARGEVGVGDRLPGARELAGSLGVNVHTVLKGYQLLRDEGLLELRRGRGAVVTAAAVDGRAALQQAVAAAQEAARNLGLAPDELATMILEGY